jgi:hypothetical protein
MPHFAQCNIPELISRSPTSSRLREWPQWMQVWRCIRAVLRSSKVSVLLMTFNSASSTKVFVHRITRFRPKRLAFHNLLTITSARAGNGRRRLGSPEGAEGEPRRGYPRNTALHSYGES